MHNRLWAVVTCGLSRVLSNLLSHGQSLLIVHDPDDLPAVGPWRSSLAMLLDLPRLRRRSRPRLPTT